MTESTPSAGSEDGNPERPAPQRPGRILVADDNPALRETLHDILAYEGYLVQQAGDGYTALEILNRASVDVVILDLAMPGMSGVELLRHIDPPPPMVIVHSAFFYFDEGEVLGQVGAKVFRSMTKPVHPSELLAALSDAMAALATD